MHNEITIVVPYRPREHYDSFPDLQRVIESFTAPYIVSVYGEMDERLEQYSYIHTPTSEKWNRSRCLNLGVDAVETDFIFTNDADCIWVTDVAAEVVDALKRECHVVYRVRRAKTVNTHGAGMQGYSKHWPVRWDERYEGYGREDIDMFEQAKRTGRHIEELSGGIVHLPHPKDTMIEDWKSNKVKFHQKWK